MQKAQSAAHLLLKAGFEEEFSLARFDDLELVPEHLRNSVVHSLGEFGQREMGASQIESISAAPLPICPEILTAIEEDCTSRDRRLNLAATSYRVSRFRIGLWPFGTLDDIRISQTARYQKMRQGINEMRKNGRITIGRGCEVDVADAAVPAICNGMHVNIEVPSANDAIAVANACLAISPELIALSGNSRFMAGTDLGLSDGRIAAYEAALDIRSCGDSHPSWVGLPKGYYRDQAAYDRHFESLPKLNGRPEMWNDVLIKNAGSATIVESRFLDVQPSPHEATAVAAVFLGLLASSLELGLRRPWKTLVADRQNAIEHGLHGFIHEPTDKGWIRVPTDQAVESALRRAELGLRALDVDCEHYIALAARRLIVGSPSDVLANELVAVSNRESSMALSEAFRNTYREPLTVMPMPADFSAVRNVAMRG